MTSLHLDLVSQLASALRLFALRLFGSSSALRLNSSWKDGALDVAGAFGAFLSSFSSFSSFLCFALDVL